MNSQFSGSEVWTEKYRPKKFEEVVGQEEIVKRVKSLVNSINIPHLLFAGPAGTGKSTLALIVVRELFGASWRENYLELNASDERGIDVVRQKVKDFARTKALGNVPFKVIFLDEADALTREAQQALRRTMENFTGTCRFILSCNYSSRIIEPIQSRCVVFRFKPLEKEEVIERLKIVAKSEKLKIDDKALSAIFYVSLGDMRKGINILQACSALDDTIDEKTVFSVSARARPEEVKKMVLLAKEGKFKESRDLLYKLMFEYGMSGEDIVGQVYREVVDLSDDHLPIKEKVKLIQIISEINFRVSEGANDRLQIEAMLAMFNMK